jgi:hypothetical protein
MSNDYTYSPTNSVRIADLSPGSSSSEERAAEGHQRVGLPERRQWLARSGGTRLSLIQLRLKSTLRRSA